MPQYTMVCALGAEGVVLRQVFPGKLTTSRWHTFIAALKDALVGQMRMVVWDNLNIHHDRHCINMLRNDGHLVFFAPPYSPAANPIEYMFSQLKSHLRRFKAKGAKAMREAVDRGLSLVDTQHILAYYFTAWGHALKWEA